MAIYQLWVLRQKERTVFPFNIKWNVQQNWSGAHCLLKPLVRIVVWEHAANSKERCVQQFADIQLRNLCSFCWYPQDVNLSINLQRAATFGWHLISNKDQTAISPPEISASRHSCSTWARGVSRPSITLVKQLTALRWHHVFIAHKQVILGWIGTVVCIIKNATRAAQCRLCFRASSIQNETPPHLQGADPCRSRNHSPKWMATFQGKCSGKTMRHIVRWWAF